MSRRLWIARRCLAKVECQRRGPVKNPGISVDRRHHGRGNLPSPARASPAPCWHIHETGRNPYRGDAAAFAAGRQLYVTWCQGCHNPDGSGRIGRSLIGNSFTYDRVPTDVGMFEVIYGDAAGAMQSFKEIRRRAYHDREALAEVRACARDGQRT